MIAREEILQKVRDKVRETEPNAKVILYGSYARGEYNKDSDLDLLVLLDKDHTSRKEIKRIKYALYDIEFETGVIVSPLVLSRHEWEAKHRRTPFFENVTREGQVL